MNAQSLTLHAAVGAVLDEAMAASDDVLVLGDTAGRPGDPTTAALTRHGDRVRALPVADRGTLGLALGLALAGKRPVVELSGPDRLVASLEVLSEAARISRGGGFTAPLVVRLPWGTEARGIDRAVSSVLGIDGLTVVAASDAATAAGLLRTALSATGPVVLLEPRSVAAERALVDDRALPFRARTVQAGTHLTIATWGAGVEAGLRAAQQLSAEGISAELLDLVALSPVDREALGASVQRTGRLVAVHPEDSRLADAARAIALDQAFLFLEAPLASASEAPEAIVRAAREAVHY